MTDWLDLADSYAASLDASRYLAQIEGAGLGYASQMHATVANSAGQAYLDSLVEKQEYALTRRRSSRMPCMTILASTGRVSATSTQRANPALRRGRTSTEESDLRPHICTLVLCAALGMAALAGCTSEQPGQAIPGGTPPTSRPPTTSVSPSTTSSGESADLPSDGAPKVESPIETTKFQQDPCLVLTDTQTTKLGVASPGTARATGVGNACRWRNDDGGSIEISWGEKIPRGLSAAYKANNAGKYVYFNALPSIEGLPAVALDVVDRRDKGSCGVEVGVTDRLTFQVGLSQSRSKIGTAEPCRVAAEVAAEAVQTMKAGG
ncbi:DUF3558 domain-containing protein [Actinokineospora sp.]|uniref:DUF3558 domain-containing protein n=1 Tax=Actinokineospora sp. TaxID=1872133 RepID=UPI0040376FA9